MSYIPPPSPLDNELARAKEQEVERKADEYARAHPDGAPPKRHAISWVLDVLRGRRRERGE